MNNKYQELVNLAVKCNEELKKNGAFMLVRAEDYEPLMNILYDWCEDNNVPPKDIHLPPLK